MRSLTAATAGLVGPRDPAQPLLTLVQGDARVELSGSTTSNWVAKTANLLVDGLGGPQRVGVLLPLHWQLLVVVLAGVATGATVVVARDDVELRDCDAAFTTVEHAAAALAAGVGDVLAVSTHPLGLPLPALPLGVLDHAREVPGHADAWTGPAPERADVLAGGAPLGPLPPLGLTAADRLLVDLPTDDPDTLGVLLGTLAASAAVVLLPGGAALDVRAVTALAGAERATASAGLAVPGLRRVA